MFKYILSAAAISLMTLSSASALPAASPEALLQAAGAGTVQEVQHSRRSSERYRHSRRNSDRYRAGRRYDRAPSGYRRYSSRPSYWQSRHCVMVGPVWFCP